jgi:hypothetical protein
MPAIINFLMVELRIRARSRWIRSPAFRLQ